VGTTIASTSDLASFKSDARLHGMRNNTFHQGVFETWVRAVYGVGSPLVISYFNRLLDLSMSISPSVVMSNATYRPAVSPSSTHGSGGQTQHI
jgi:hypothetical protein